MFSDSRVAALRSRMHGTADAFIAMTPANVRYLTGFDGVFDEEPSSIVVITAAEQHVVTDSRFAEAAGEAAQGTPWRLSIVSEPAMSYASRMLSDAGVQRVALESALPHGTFTTFAQGFAGETVGADGWPEAQRSVKDADEIARIAAAQELTDRAFAHILEYIDAGRTERDVALELEFFMRRNGSEGVAFNPIVASGPNSSLPHASVTDREIRAGDFLKLDFGARVDGYCADMTRTVVIGEASEEQLRIYDAVLSANLAGLRILAAGRTGVEVDRAAREVIEAAGFGERFGHGLGHGVGIEVHEAPSLSPRAGDTPLVAGEVVTVEPGVYIPGFGGVRIEDLVVVEAGGCRVLTASPKDLLVV